MYVHVHSTCPVHNYSVYRIQFGSRLDHGLEKERQKSGTQEWWKSQELWAPRAFDHPLSPNDIKRFFWSQWVEDATYGDEYFGNRTTNRSWYHSFLCCLMPFMDLLS